MKRKLTMNERLGAAKVARAAGLNARRVLVVPRNPVGLYPTRRSGATELKSVDTPNQTQAINSLGFYTVCNIPEEGSSFYNRIGRRIRMKSLHLRGQINPSNTNANAVPQGQARIMVVYDRQSNGALPALSDLILAYSASGATTSAVLDGINMNNRDRFLVLMDNQVTLPAIGVNGATPANITMYPDPNANAGGNQGTIMVNRFIKLKGLETHFKASTGAIGDIATGALLVFTLSSDPNASQAYNFNWTSRLKFYD